MGDQDGGTAPRAGTPRMRGLEPVASAGREGVPVPLVLVRVSYPTINDARVRVRHRSVPNGVRRSELCRRSPTAQLHRNGLCDSYNDQAVAEVREQMPAMVSQTPARAGTGENHRSGVTEQMSGTESGR